MWDGNISKFLGFCRRGRIYISVFLAFRAISSSPPFYPHHAPLLAIDLLLLVDLFETFIAKYQFSPSFLEHFAHFQLPEVLLLLH